MPEVSVVIPAYNAELTLGETLASVISQTFGEFEVIVVDDGSSDATAELVGRVGDERLRVISVPNGGVSRARNRGIAEAVGELVALLDADDVWLPTKLERQVALMRERPNVGMTFTAAQRVDAEARLIGAMPARSYADYTEALLLHSLIISASCSSGVVRREIATGIGGFDPSFSQSADWDFWLRLSRATRFAAILEPLVLYRTGAGNMSSDISLLERDTFAVLKKTFRDPAFAPYLPIRRRVYSNHWMICAGSYLHAGHLRPAVRCLARGLQADPRNVWRPLGLPQRWLKRLTTSSVR